ncbi:hypothetical protein [Paenibacillus sp. Leaf72]|uniref:hypothetical protein n=1 Tax=Paenibacillus sp. Leaf72 TaxID=1736234 RepID=UPI0006FF5101|nr:hypothetical protein [Paenibacillus sp. Leaf72]KQO06236.1 hypothetical protein ASF12_32580 [Paenibacillus sp. Leaf72]
MNTAEALDYYLAKDVLPAAKALYRQIMDYFIKHKQGVLSEFAAGFRRCCTFLQEQRAQSNEHINASYIQYSLLLSQVLLSRPAYLIEAFDDGYYLGKQLAAVTYHPYWLFDPLFAFYEQIKQAAKKYVQKISLLEVERIFLIELKQYEKLMAFIAKEAIEAILDTPEYEHLPYEGEVQFRIGVFRGETELLFIKNEKNDAVWREIHAILSHQTR